MSKNPENILPYARPLPLAAPLALKAGPLQMKFVSGELRSIRLGEKEIVRRIYVGVRDRNWGTVQGKVLKLVKQVREDSFQIEFEVEHKHENIRFTWQGTITGDAHGTVRFDMNGEAKSTFLRNRLGFCVLHPPKLCAGMTCMIEHVDGSREYGTFPDFISPTQPFTDIRAITQEVARSAWMEIRLEGDSFEMEDQRNWTDASFKTYCTVQRMPKPVEVQQGTNIGQSITICLQSIPDSELQAIRAGTTNGIRLLLKDSDVRPLPRLGLGVSSGPGALSENEADRLKRLWLSHLRLDLKLSDPESERKFKNASAESELLGVPLEVGLQLSPESMQADLENFAVLLEQAKPRVQAWILLNHKNRNTLDETLTLMREHLAKFNRSAQFGIGTTGNFMDLNSTRPFSPLFDFYNYSINPQVHAFDNDNLVENLEGQHWTIKTAHQFATNKTLSIGPVTLKPRNKNNLGDPLPAGVDARQMSTFAAGWTAISIRELSSAPVDRVTFFETIGWNGIMEGSDSSPDPKNFPSIPGTVFPVYHVFADLAEYAGGDVLEIDSERNLEVDALAVRKDAKTRIIAVNFTDQPQLAEIHGILSAATVTFLDETSIEMAVNAPEQWREQPGRILEPQEGRLKLHLKPFALARIDLISR